MTNNASRITHHASPAFFVTGGTLRRDAPCYVPRQADHDLYAGLAQGQFCYVLTSRQMGKSSLMVRTAVRLREKKIAVAVLDLTAVGQNLSAEQWYEGLLNLIGQQLNLEDELEAFWLDHERLGPLQRWMRAMREVVLRQNPNRVVIFVDEIDAVRSLPFSTDEFFAGIREFYNRRTEDPELSRLTFCLLGVATPSDLIRDTRTTPFNIGQRIELNDFTETEAAPLAQGLRPDEQLGAKLLKRIFYWTDGHPFLTQRLCQAVAEDASVVDPAGVDRVCQELFLSTRARERDDNLLFVRERLLRSEADLAGLLHLYEQAHRRQRVPDDETNPLVSVLRLSGITHVEGGCLRVRNRIYSQVFDQNWITANMPDAELRRQRAAYRRGLLRAATVSAVIIVVIAGLAFTALKEQRIARTERAKAERRFNEVRKLANSFMFELHDAIENLSGATPARKLLVKHALEYLDSLAAEANGDSSLQRELAMAYQKVGDLQGNPYGANLGDTAGALESYGKALQIRQSLVTADQKNAEFRADLATSHERMADILWERSDPTGALKNYREAFQIREALSVSDPANTQIRRDLARSYDEISDALAKTGDQAGALEQSRKSLALFEALAAANPTDAAARRSVAIGYGKVSDRLARTGDKAGALENARQSLAISQALSAADPMNAKARRELGISHNKLASLLEMTGDLAGALQNYREALQIREVLSAADPTNAQARRDLAISYGMVGSALAESEGLNKALESFRQSIALFEALSAANPTNAVARRDLALGYETLGESYATFASREKAPASKRLEYWREARVWYQRELRVLLEMRDHGALMAAHAGEPDRITGEVAKCDAALAKLHGSLTTVSDR